MRRHSLMVSTVIAGLLAAGSVHAAKSEWPAYRGAAINGISTESDVFDGDSFALDVVWQKDIGSGYSGVVVADGYVVTAFRAGENDVVAAFDEETGEERWRYELAPTYVGHDGSHDGPVATPLIADNTVVMLAPRGKLVGLKLKNGQERWSVDLAEEHGARKPHYGFASSPILIGDRVIVEMGAEGAAVGAFDVDSGKLLWTSGDDKIDYQTPLPVQVENRTELIAAGSGKIWGVDPRSGETLWEHPHPGGGGRGAGSITPVAAGEGRFFLANSPEGSSVIKLGRDSAAVSVDTAWQGRAIRNTFNVPIYKDGHIYGYSARFLTCVDAETGEPKWRSRAPGDGFLILVDDHLVIATKEGSLHVVEATPTAFKEVAATELFDDNNWAHPAFANGHIVTRSLSGLARVSIKRGGSIASLDDRPSLAGSEFGQFLDKVKAAGDKQSVVDKFFAEVREYPIVEGDLVHFVYRGEGEDLAVAGDLSGARQERPMQRVDGTNLFYYSAKLEKDARLNYIFIRDFEEITDPRNPRTVTQDIFGREMEMTFAPGSGIKMSWFAMPDWKPSAFLEPLPAERRGRIEAHTIAVEGLPAPMGLKVYLPQGYDQSEDRYPVVYFFADGAGRERGQLIEALDGLIAAERIRPLIAAFVEIPGQLPPDALAGLFRDKAVGTIDEAYRTIAEPEARATYGTGFGGYFAFLSALYNPGLVTKVGSSSMFMFTSMEAGLFGGMKSPDEAPLQIHLSWGRYDFRNPHEAWDMRDVARKVEAALREHGYEPQTQEFVDGTGWESWKHRTDDVLEAFFPKEG